jgi:hypothetical protein
MASLRKTPCLRPETWGTRTRHDKECQITEDDKDCYCRDNKL